VTATLRGERTRNRQCAGDAQASYLHPSRRSTSRHSRASFNSRTSVFQIDDEGAIPSARSRLSSPRAESPMRSVVCKTACEGLTPSRLSTHLGDRWSPSRAELSSLSPRENRRCAPTGVPGTPAHDGYGHRHTYYGLIADHDGLVALNSLIRSPHRVRFTGDPRRGAGCLVTTPARQAGPGRCDPCAPHDRFAILSEHSSTARSFPSEGRDEGSNPSAQTKCRCNPTGRGTRLRNGVLWVRIPPSAPAQSSLAKPQFAHLERVR
jgi:hypothetical protein